MSQSKLRLTSWSLTSLFLTFIFQNVVVRRDAFYNQQGKKAL